LPFTDINLVGNNGQTPLHLAARSLEIEDKTKENLHDSILYYLLQRKGIKPDVQDDQKRTPLHHAIMRGCVNNAQQLLETKAKLLNVSHGVGF